MFWDFIKSLLQGNYQNDQNSIDELNQNYNRIQNQSSINFNTIQKVKKSKDNLKIYFKDLSNEKQLSETIIIKKNTDPTLKKLEEFLKDLQDPLSGEPIKIEPNKNLYECENCFVIYLEESFDYITLYNNGKCVCCGKKSIKLFDYFKETKLKIVIPKFIPEIITLENYKDFVGKSIKFSGTIVKILESKRGDYALMFEDKPWVEGFKLIIFYPLMKPGKGLEREFLRSLVGKTVKVRGILQKHEIYGYEILIFKRSMILDIK